MWMQPSECKQVNTPNECNQVNATKLMQLIECNQLSGCGVGSLPVGVAAEWSVHYFCDYF